MKNRAFFCTWMLLLLTLCISSGAYAFQQNGPPVGVYSAPNFRGETRYYDPGHYTMPEGFNVSSITVPQGLVVIAYEFSADRDGYGKWVDFLEDQPNVAQYGVGKRISHLYIFKRRSVDGRYWVRNTTVNGRFVEGFWFKARVPGERAPRSDSIAVVAPARPAPPPAVCTISGQVIRDKPIYGTRIHLYRPGDRQPQVSVGVSNGQYTIQNVPEGDYELRGTMSNHMTQQTPRGPIGLIIVSKGGQAVTCEKGQPVTKNFEINSSEG